jgi:hypothetical protein
MANQAIRGWVTVKDSSKRSFPSIWAERLVRIWDLVKLGIGHGAETKAFET